MSDIEPRILPVVDALNETGLVRTFSSCEGHFNPDEQTVVDRNHAYVQFIPADGVIMGDVEKWLGSLLIAFKQAHSLLPVTLTAHKRYTPVDGVIEETFVLELRPFNRFEPPARKRADIDRAVAQLVVLLVRSAQDEV